MVYKVKKWDYLLFLKDFIRTGSCITEEYAILIVHIVPNLIRAKARVAGVDRSYIWKFRQNNTKKYLKNYTYDATGIFLPREIYLPLNT